MKVMNHAEYKKSLKGKTDDALWFAMNDAKAAIDAMPEGENVSYYADEICYIVDELNSRRGKKEVTRFEVIGGERMLVLTDVHVTLSYQDGGETLKVFVKNREICENCDEFARKGDKFCSDECSEEAFDVSREGDYQSMVANSDIYPRF